MAKRRTSTRKKRKPAAKKKVRGFAANAARIAKQKGISMERARAILAAGTRRASPAAKRKNPNLRKVRGKPRRRR